MKVIKIFIISVIVIIIGSLVFDLLDSNINRNIENMRDTRMVWYYHNKKVAVNFLDVLTIVDNSSYNNVKNKLFSSLSDKMRQEYFGYNEYPNLSDKYKKPVILVNSVRGDLTRKNIGEYIYKVDITLVYEGVSNVNAVLLIGVNNGIIYKVDKI